MSDHTRVVRLTGSPAPRQAGIGTMMFGAPPPVSPVAPRGKFLGGLHRVIRSACLEEPRPGLFVFASTADGRIIGRLWLAATLEPRAGTVGRHESVDLPVTPEAQLSLRHFLFVVRRVQGAVRYSAIDLETPAGLYTLQGQQHLLQTEQATLLRAAGLSFWCVPTGSAKELDADPARACAGFDAGAPVVAPSIFQRMLRREPGPVGTLTMQLGAATLPLTVDRTMLERGVLVGRHDRCDVMIPDGYVSRVHAVLLDVDDTLFLVDTGSSNGTWHHSGTRVRCERVADGDAFRIGAATVRWRQLH